MWSDALQDLLDRLAAALRCGDLAALPALAQAIEAAVDDRGGAPAGDPAALRRQARRVALLLDAAERGLRAAIRRIDEIRSVRGGVLTYDTGARREARTDGGHRMAQRL